MKHPFIILLIMAIAEPFVCQQISLASEAKVIASLQKFFGSGCVFLIYSHEESEYNRHESIIQLEKLVSTQDVQATPADLRYFNLTKEKFQCKRNTPLYVLLSSGSSGRVSLSRISMNSKLTTGVWLLFVNPNFPLDTFFSEINIPFDCEFLVAHQEDDVIVLTEVYRVHSTFPLQTYDFGNWSSMNGFNWCKLQLYERRNSLDGYVIKAGYKYGKYINPDELKNDLSNGVKYYFGEVWLLLQNLLNFTTEYYYPPDNSWGAKLKNGSWSGMIGMIMKKEIDVAVDAYIITPDRIGVISFMTPLISVRSRPFIKRPVTSENKWSDFLAPFSTKLWMAIVTTMVLLASFLSIIYRVGRHYCAEDAVGSVTYGFFDSLYYVFGSFCQQGHAVTPISGSCRTVYVTSYLISVILTAAYSAALISYLTVQRIVLPFTTFQELLDVGTYKLGVLDRSAQLNYFDATTNPVLEKVYNRLIVPYKNALPVTESEGLRRICEDYKYAFMTPFDTPLSRNSKLKCRMLEIPKASIPGSLAMPIVRDHPFVGLINHYLENLRRTGVLNRVYKTAWPRRPENWSRPWKSVNIQEVAPIFSLLMAGTLISIFIFIVEYLINLRKSTHTKNMTVKRQMHIKAISSWSDSKKYLKKLS